MPWAMWISAQYYYLECIWIKTFGEANVALAKHTITIAYTDSDLNKPH